MNAFSSLTRVHVACADAVRAMPTLVTSIKEIGRTVGLACALASTPAYCDWFDGERPLDRGGDVGAYLKRIVATGAERHVISGDCMSACTMWLGKKGTCVTPDAVLYFHAASIGDSRLEDANPWQSISSVGNSVLLSMYPTRVRIVVRGWLNSPDFHTLSGRQLAALGVPLCQSPAA